MRKRLVATLVLVSVGLAASAVPAFTADSPTGTVTVSITAQAPAAPCITVGPGSVNFGTLPFSTSNAEWGTGSAEITVNFCGSASSQNLLGSTTPATGPSGSWTPRAYDGTVHPCAAVNQFYLSIFGFTTPGLYMTETRAPVLQSLGGPPATFPLGDKVFRLEIVMPCQGSNGGTKTLTATFTAVLP